MSEAIASPAIGRMVSPERVEFEHRDVVRGVQRGHHRRADLAGADHEDPHGPRAYRTAGARYALEDSS